jgi:hypothetical protein
MKLALTTSALFLLFSIFKPQTMSAQTLDGEYRLSGVPETASAFRFTPDGRFDFFFIYGAVDRTATGTYTVEGNVIKLKSEKEPGKDFPITLETKKGKGYTIQVNDPNSILLHNIICIYYIGEIENVAYSDKNGTIKIDAKEVDKIYLMHQLFPDIASLIKDENNTNNYFEATLSPNLGFVSFQGIDFTIDGESISCLPNYVIPFDRIIYEKE